MTREEEIKLELKLFVESRNNAVMKYMDGDKEPFIQHIKKYHPELGLPSDKAIDLAVWKMACNITNIPKEYRDRACALLLDHGSNPIIC